MLELFHLNEILEFREADKINILRYLEGLKDLEDLKIFKVLKDLRDLDNFPSKAKVGTEEFSKYVKTRRGRPR